MPFLKIVDVVNVLFTWNNATIPMDIGIPGDFDIGKVYLDDGLVNPWKSSHTMGV